MAPFSYFRTENKYKLKKKTANVIKVISEISTEDFTDESDTEILYPVLETHF